MARPCPRISLRLIQLPLKGKRRAEMPLPGGQLLAATPKRQGEWVGVYTHDDENGRYILDRKSHTVNWTRQEKRLVELCNDSNSMAVHT